MDWLVNVAILLVVGSFILVNTRKRKYNQSGDVLPRYTTQRSLAVVEKESQEIIKRELSRDAPTYEWIRSKGGYGFLFDYLHYARNDETLTTTAKSDIVKTLSENDLLRDLKLLLIFVILY